MGVLLGVLDLMVGLVFFGIVYVLAVKFLGNHPFINGIVFCLAAVHLVMTLGLM